MPPVLVSGAGPVGLVAACALLRRGLHVRVLEKRPGLSTVSRASTWHPPSLALLARFGLLERMFELGSPVPVVQYRVRGRGIVAELPLSMLAGEAEVPMRLHLEQAAVTPLLLEYLRGAADERGPRAQVCFGMRVVAVAEERDSVVVTTEDERGDRMQHEGSHLLVAEGAQSATRAALGVEFAGIDYPQPVLRLMTRSDLREILPGAQPLTYLYRDDESIAFLRMPDCWRTVLRVPAGMAPERAMQPDFYEAELARFMEPEAMRALRDVVCDVFHVSRRCVDSMRRGRSFFVGDAAHISTTRGGMNMNCGIQDACRIADALADALEAPHRAAEILETACAERMLAAQHMLAHTERAISGGRAWLAHVEQSLGEAERMRALLRRITMLDAPRPQPALAH